MISQISNKMENSITNQQNEPDAFFSLRFDNYTDTAVKSVNQIAAKDFAIFQQAIDFLIETIEPEKIFLTPDFQQTGERKLIVVIRENDHSTFEEREKLQDHPLLKKQRITLQFIKGYGLECEYQSSPIYLTVSCNRKTLIYDNGCFALAEMDKAALMEFKTTANSQFYKGLERMDTFLNSAIIFWEHNPAMAAFHLHQAMELGLNALIRSVTGTVKTTHLIRRLLQSSLICGTEIYQIMSTGDEAGEQSIDQLEEAYLGYRYKNNYQVTAQCVANLIEKVTKLRNAIEINFLDWLLRYELEILDMPDHE